MPKYKYKYYLSPMTHGAIWVSFPTSSVYLKSPYLVVRITCPRKLSVEHGYSLYKTYYGYQAKW